MQPDVNTFANPTKRVPCRLQLAADKLRRGSRESIWLFVLQQDQEQLLRRANDVIWKGISKKAFRVKTPGHRYRTHSCLAALREISDRITDHECFRWEGSMGLDRLT